jgi:hypothetical protein
VVGIVCGTSVPFANMVDETVTVANGAWQTRVFVGCNSAVQLKFTEVNQLHAF